ncbi:MAG: outer membrane beta-barrel protein [Verrucomicrobiota bacterium]
MPLTVLAQSQRDFLMRTSPYPVFRAPESSNYNLRWGRLKGLFRASAQVEFNDNINLAEVNPESDIAFGPTLGIGFFWPMNQNNLMQFDVGVGYRWYLNHSELDSFTVLPNTRWDYRMFLGQTQIDIHDNLSIQVDPISRAEISGSPGGILNFKVLNNTAGIQADRKLYRDLGAVAGFDYTIVRSLTDQFTSLDRDDQTANAGLYYQVSPQWTVGVNGSVTSTDYLETVQNDGTSYSAGVHANYIATKFITVDLAAGYSSSSFETGGLIGDTSEFSGLTYSLSVQHRVNPRLNHNVRVSKSANLGFGNNFTDTLALQYGLMMRLSKRLNVNSTFSYESLDFSGPRGEVADRYLFYFGTGYQVAKNWMLGLGFAFAWKNSNLPGNDYQQNRLTIDVTRQF